MKTTLRSVFPNDDHYWRIEWVGGVHRNPDVPSERLIGVSIAPLLSVATDDNPTALEALTTDRNRRRTIEAGAGTIPSLVVGSIWRRQRMLAAVPYDLRECVIDLNATPARLLDAGHQIAPNQWLIPPFLHALPHGMLGSRCAVIAIGSDAHALVIPCFEVLRAWYVRSTAMANRLFSGPLKHVEDKIFDRAKSGVDVPTQTWRVQLRTGLCSSDVLPAAILACHKDAFMNASKLFDRILKDHFANRPLHIEIAPPPCSGRLRARGIDISSRGDRRFLVFDLETIPYPLPAGGIDWDLDNTNEPEPDASQEPREAWKKKPPARKPEPADQLAHIDEPDNGGGATRESYDAPSISSPVLIRRLHNHQKSKSRSAGGPLPSASTTRHSTGAGTYGATSSRRLTIAASSDPDADAARAVVGFDYIADLQTALSRYAGTRCSAIAASERFIRHQSGIRSFFPAWIDTKLHAWSFVHAHVRQAIVLQIEHEGLFGYAIEIERRPSKFKDGVSEQYRLGFLGASDLGRANPMALAKVLRNLAIRHGIWPSESGLIDGFRLYAHRRRKAPDEFAFDLLNQLRRWASRAPLQRSQLAREPEASPLQGTGDVSAVA
ncbi:MAG TPA: hypothetical protein VGE57_09155 [Solimonas sp.]